MGPRVLIVEDEEPLMLLLRYNLEAEGYEVDSVSRGDEAEIRLREQVPDIVYLDMRFDRTPEGALLGNMVELVARFNGDVARARRFQQDNQGLFVLRALRERLREPG